MNIKYTNKSPFKRRPFSYSSLKRLNEKLHLSLKKRYTDKKDTSVIINIQLEQKYLQSSLNLMSNIKRKSIDLAKKKTFFKQNKHFWFLRVIVNSCSLFIAFQIKLIKGDIY